MSGGAAPATLVWFAPEPPDAAARRALLDWARAHGVELEPPRDEAPPPPLPASEGAADAVEELLERARDALAARDGDAADRATEAAESLLRAHPELPQAAWLFAEVERARAARWRRTAPEDPEAADRAWSRAAALDGGREPGLAEAGSTATGASAAGSAELALELPYGAGQARLDGRDVATGPAGSAPEIATRAGPHALVVLEGATAVWARWIEVAPGPSRFAIDVPAPAPCSLRDTARASFGGGGAGIEASGVRCPRWIAAAPWAGGALQLASCAAGACGPIGEWRDAGEPAPWARPAPVPVAPEAASPTKGAGAWPAWATWAIAGAGAAALAAGVAVLASGALSPAPAETRFVSGGLKGVTGD